MTSGTRFTRRTAIATASAIGALVMTQARFAQASPLVIPDEETWESNDGALAVTYDPDVWIDPKQAIPGVDQLIIATDPTFGNDRYWLQIGESAATWSSVDEAAANAMDAYFSQGMMDTIILDQYSTDTSFGWVQYADFQGGPRTVNVIQYALTDDDEWYEAMHSINIGAFEKLDINDVYDAVSLNDESVFVIASQRTMIRAIEDAFAA